MDLNLHNVCRLCARKCEDMQNIFQDISSEPEIYMDVAKDLSGMLPLKIATVTSIKVCRGLTRKIREAQKKDKMIPRTWSLLEEMSVCLAATTKLKTFIRRESLSSSK